jgi:hypothetical protein
MSYAEKLVKTWTNRVKAISFVDKDVVLTTKEAIKYLKISKPTYLYIFALEGSRPSKREMAGGCTDPSYTDF